MISRITGEIEIIVGCHFILGDVFYYTARLKLLLYLFLNILFFQFFIIQKLFKNYSKNYYLFSLFSKFNK
jgi:hypothetical protein